MGHVRTVNGGRVPSSLAHLRSEPGGREWLASLPDLLDDLAEEWCLTLLEARS